MPPTPGAEWAVARFQIDDMYSNDNHRRVNDPKQRYQAFSFTQNGDLKDDSFVELDWLVVWRGKDSEAPSAPVDFKAEAKGDHTVFRWSPSTDNLMVRCYELLRKDGEAWTKITHATRPMLALPKAQVPAGSYAVRAVDVAGNASESATLTLP